MEWLIDVDWKRVLVPDTPLLEIFVRGTLTYLALFFLLRVVLKRQSTGLGVTDLLVIVLIADASQNAMAGDYQSVPDGIFLVAVVLGWALALDWLSYRSKRMERILKPRKLPLIKDGQLITENMHKELVTRDELRSQLRQQGVEDFSDVRRAFMEPNGKISVVTFEQADQ
jgi:uncharacterized membrane protein YcaP (DUF421 family)